MRHFTLLLMIAAFVLPAMGQQIRPADIQPDSTNYPNIYIKKISEDSLHSAYIIWIKQGVAAHYHQRHSEVIHVLEGSGIMTLDSTEFELQGGTQVHIPMGSTHSVITTSEFPLKVVSIQSPRFDGDRIFVNP